MAMLVVRTSHRLVLVGLDVVLECLAAFHGGGTMTSSMQHMIAKEALPKAQAFGYFPIGILTSLNRTY
jgi:hypothetical protein